MYVYVRTYIIVRLGHLHSLNKSNRCLNHSNVSIFVMVLKCVIISLITKNLVLKLPLSLAVTLPRSRNAIPYKRTRHELVRNRSCH